MVISGDKVRHGAHVRDAVDVTPNGFVVMRDEADLDGLDLTAATVDEVEVVGGIEGVPGRVECGAGGGGRVVRQSGWGGGCWRGGVGCRRCPARGVRRHARLIQERSLLAAYPPRPAVTAHG